jgi:hypothetical protein
MDKFKLETSIQFPFFKLNEEVSYSEVKKPSGIAYMLLVLINESNNKRAKLAYLLSNFGVSQTLYYIYLNTLNDLIREDILHYIGYYVVDNKNFENLTIGDFVFTDKGRKVFAEESIPTGVTKSAKIPVYYNIALKQLTFSMSSDLEAKPLMDCAITEDYINKFTCEKDIEDFINFNKGVKIPIYENGKLAKNELIKKEEIVTKVENLSKENWVGKYDCSFNINGDSLVFDFEDKTIQKFFDSNYTSEMVNKAISLKNKFKFKSSYSENLSLSDFQDYDISNVIIPKNIDDELKQKGKLLITKGNYKNNNYLVESQEGLENYNKTVEFIIVDQSDNKTAYVPGVYNFNSELGIISIPLVLKLKVSNEDIQKVLKSYVYTLNTYSEDNFKELVKITGISKDYDLAYSIIENYVSKDAESNIVILNEMKTTAMQNSNILTKYKELLSLNYNNYLKDITEDNLETTLKITNSIPKFLNIASKEVLDTIFEVLGNVKNKIKVFETLVDKGFDKASVILYVNPVEDVLNTRNVNEKSLIDLINYDNCVKSLKVISNIKDYKNYVFDEENVNRSEFKNTYNTAKNLQNSINYLRTKNGDLFNEYDSFMKLFGTINDDFNMLDSALKNPNNIKKELVEKKINSGDYQFVFVNLSAKLESILKNKYKLEGKLSDMLSEARKSGIIDRNIINDLHEFRENRNAYIHPEDRTSNFKVDDLRRWNEEIFELGEDEKHESSSND